MTPSRPEPGTEITLQNVIGPEADVAADTALYYHLPDGGQIDPGSGHIHLASGAVLTLDTYFNAFDLGEWTSTCNLERLSFRLAGQGNVRLRFTLATIEDAALAREENRKRTIFLTTLLEQDATLGDTEHVIDLSQALATTGAVVLYVEIEALEGGATFATGRFTGGPLPEILPHLAISITTFRREAEVEATARRLEAYLATCAFSDRISVQVVDNGQSANIAQTEQVKVFPNANLGGAGGFARGMLEARASGASHCLFMDDDASFHMENIGRTFALLALARDPATTVAGAMITNTRKYEMWENGSIFNGLCRPIGGHTNLREPEPTLRLMFRAAEPLPANGYGAWWYFAFPLAVAKHYPFPFFVRGDDINFSLANPFDIHTLNGVVSFQDAFSDKESPQTLYLDLRNHLVQNLLFPELGFTAKGAVRVALRFILRAVAKLHYEAAEAQILALKDVMSGPDFFVENADMSQRRADIKAMTHNEVWKPMEARPTKLRTGRRVTDRFWALTLNGHLLPFFGLFGQRRVLRLSIRGPIWTIWGAREITYVDRAGGRGYTVRFDRRRGLSLTWQTLGLTLRLIRDYPRLRDLYRARYPEITSEASWRKLLGLPPAG